MQQTLQWFPGSGDSAVVRTVGRRAHQQAGSQLADCYEFVGIRQPVNFAGRLQVFNYSHYDTRRALNTSSTCPGTLTFRQILTIFPLPSIKKVERSIPMYLRPYMLFSTHEP